MRYVFGDYSLDTQRYELCWAGTRVKLQPKVFEVLTYLIEHRERLVSKRELLEQLWPQQFVGEATLISCIRMVRQAVGDTGQAQRVVQTFHGRGFRFVAVLKGHHHERRESIMPPYPATPSQLEPPGNPATSERVVPDDQVQGVPERPTAPVVDAEHKSVTVLCAGMAEATALASQLGPEPMYRLMQACFATAHRVMLQYGGTLTHIAGDGFVALFGAPLADEDHARRAILAAVALQQALQEYQESKSPAVPLGIGVHTGPVVVGCLGEESHRPYTAVEETVDVANRLRQLAVPGVILLSAATQQLVRDEVQVDNADTVEKGGRVSPIQVYQVQSVTRRRSGVLGQGGRALSQFVGCEWEMAMLHERLRHVIQGQGQAIGIAGEPGIGKSRLLYEFAQSLHARPVTYGEGHCLAYARATPYLPIQELLRQLCGITEVDSSEAITTKLHAYLGTVGMTPADEAPYLLQVLGVAAEGDPLAAHDPRAIKAQTFATLQQFCLSISRRQALILAVENLHWIDPTSEEWLTSLVERIAGAAILVLVTYRPGYRPAWLAQSYATQLALPRLTADDSLVLVQSVPQSTHLPERLQQAIVRTAAGNPFFLEELARAGGEHGREHPTRTIPDTIQGVLAARIDRLPPAAKRLLQAAAVIGPQVSVPLLQAISEMPEDTLTGSLRHVQAAEFLYETHLVPEPVYTFTHALTQEVAYQSLLHKRRRAIHAQIVDALERLYPGRLDEHVDQLAHHAFRGEVWDKALLYGRQAGGNAMERSAYREAVVSLEQALVATQHLPEQRDTLAQALDLCVALRNALLILREPRRGFDYLRQAVPLAEGLGDHRQLGEFDRTMIHTMIHACWSIGEYDDAIAHSQRALTLAAASGDVFEQAVANGLLGTIYCSLGDYRGAMDVLRRAIGSLTGELLYKRSRTTIADSVRARAWLVRCLAELREFAEGIAWGEEAARIAGAAANPSGTVFSQSRLGHLVLQQGDLEHAMAVLESAHAHCRAADIQLYLPEIMACLGLAYAMSGRIAEALHLLDQIVVRDKSGGGGSSLMTKLGEAYLVAGRAEHANGLAERALILSRDRKERGNQAWAQRLLADIAARREPPDADQAEAHYRQALALAEECSMRPLQAHCHLGLGTLHTTMSRREQARAELSTAITLYRAMAMTFWLPGARAALAGVARSGSPDSGSGS
jgi:class 3 adenylate cyclase/DNA-binding winged helix-turn-helix (wHTH) protein/tetratricopeptide (TPR) repeat protein